MKPELLIKDFENRAQLIEYFENTASAENFLQNNNELKTFSVLNTEAYSVRTLVDGAWGFASTSNKEELRNIFKKSLTLALNASKIKKEKTIMKELEINKDYVKHGAKTDPFIIPYEEKVKFLNDFNKKYSSPLLKNIDTSMSFSKNKHLYINSLGAHVTQEKIYSQIFSAIIGGEDLVKTYSARKAKKGYELISEMNCESFIKETELKLKKLSQAPNAKPGTYNIIMDPIISGTFFHEAVGHALEADFLREKTTCLSMGEELNPEITLYDDPTLPHYWGSYTYDSEGIRSKPSVLIHKGKVVNFINDISSFFDVNGLKKTANGRAESPHYLPTPRMSNTVVKPGKLSISELFEKVKTGLLVSGFYGGAVEPISGVFSFKAENATIIEKGEEKKILRGVTLSGDLKQLMKNITGVGKDVKDEHHGGSCGKREQSVPVSEKMPYITVEGVNVGN